MQKSGNILAFTAVPTLPNQRLNNTVMHNMNTPKFVATLY